MKRMDIGAVVSGCALPINQTHTWVFDILIAVTYMPWLIAMPTRYSRSAREYFEENVVGFKGVAGTAASL